MCKIVHNQPLLLRLPGCQCPWSGTSTPWLGPHGHLLPPDGRFLAPHPALLLAQWVASVYSQQLVHTPVLISLKEEDVAVGPGEGGVRTGRHPGEEHGQRFGVKS